MANACRSEATSRRTTLKRASISSPLSRLGYPSENMSVGTDLEPFRADDSRRSLTT